MSMMCLYTVPINAQNSNQNIESNVRILFLREIMMHMLHVPSLSCAAYQNIVCHHINVGYIDVNFWVLEWVDVEKVNFRREYLQNL